MLAEDFWLSLENLDMLSWDVARSDLCFRKKISLLWSGEWFEKGQERQRKPNQEAVIVIHLINYEIYIWQIQLGKDQDLLGQDVCGGLCVME